MELLWAVLCISTISSFESYNAQELLSEDPFNANNDIDASLAQSQGTQKSQIAAQNVLGRRGLVGPNNDIDALLAQSQGKQKSQIAVQNVLGRSGLGYLNNNIDALLAQSQGAQESQVATQNFLQGKDSYILQRPGYQWQNNIPLPYENPNSQNPWPIIPRPLRPNNNPVPQVPRPPGWPVINPSPRALINEVIIKNVNGVLTPVISNPNQRPNLIASYKLEQYREYLIRYILETLVRDEVKYLIYNAKTEEERARADMLIQNYRMIIYAFTEFLHSVNPLAGYIQTLRIIARNRPSAYAQEIVGESEVDSTVTINESESLFDEHWSQPLVPYHQPEYEGYEECCSETDIKIVVNIKEVVNYELFCQPFNTYEIVELVEIILNKFVVKLIQEHGIQIEILSRVAKTAVVETLQNEGVYPQKRCRNDLPNRWNIKPKLVW